MLNAGVPIKKSVAGIAMGLVKEGDNTVVLSDILGEEDHLGDMDFKVSGTRDGITAFQMDIKISGVTQDILTRALAQAREGRMHILNIMNQAISEPRSEISPYAPKILTMKVEVDKIGLIIGPGGKNIKGISEKTDTNINIENDGTITIYGKNLAASEAARQQVLGMVEEPEVGRIYQATVKKIMDFGAFAEFMPGREGLIHISRLARHRVENVSDVLTEGQQIPVKLLEIDKMGRNNLSYIDALDGGEGAPQGGDGEGRRGDGEHRRSDFHRGDSGRRDSGDRGDRGPRPHSRRD